MVKYGVVFMGVMLITVCGAFADLKEDFSGDNISADWKTKGSKPVIVKEGDNSILELSAVQGEKQSSVKIPTEFNNRNISGQFDWKCDEYNNGYIFLLSDWSFKKIVFGLRLQGRAIHSVSFTKKGRIEKQKILEIKRDKWYRIVFKLKENDLTYVVKIVQRNEDNTEDDFVGYDSSEDWDSYYIHKSNPANMIYFAFKAKKGDSSYYYDNFDIKNK